MDYPSNSHKSREENKEEKKKPIAPVVNNPGRTKKRSISSKLVDAMITEDIESAKNYILSDVIAPALQRTILDVITNSARIIFNIDPVKMDPRGQSKISYRSYYDYQNDRGNSKYSKRSMGVLNYDEVIVDTKGEAEAILSTMDDILDAQSYVTIGDLYDLANIQTNNHMVNSYGWTNLRGAKSVRIIDGNGERYVLKFPRAIALNN